MGEDSEPSKLRRLLQQAWPWLILSTLVAVAAWHAFDFPDDLDVEFPKVARPTFSTHPPAVYRLAEPGDTLDRIGIYLSSLAIVVSIVGFCRGATRRPWSAALAVSIAVFWYSANPARGLDGWHGMGWSTVLDSQTPRLLRIGLLGSAGVLSCVIIWGLWPLLSDPSKLPEICRTRRVRGLLLMAIALAILRLIGLNGIEPAGYWPRCAFVGALVVFTAALLRMSSPLLVPRKTRLVIASAGVAAWYALVLAGIWLTWYHRPLDRLRTVVPGRIYMSAMPTSSGLEIVQKRHHFKTIINLFPEDTEFRSPRLDQELRFAKSHGITYYGSPTEVAKSNEFLDLTLKLARDPDAWPILVHCHACMDRTPAWVGIYRYVVEGWKLDDVFRFIEEHRGYRPKASVTLLYNRVLPRLAPARHEVDPTAALLQGCAKGTRDPYYTQLEAELKGANREALSDVLGESDAAALGGLPSLTPRR